MATLMREDAVLGFSDFGLVLLFLILKFPILAKLSYMAFDVYFTHRPRFIPSIYRPLILFGRNALPAPLFFLFFFLLLPQP